MNNLRIYRIHDRYIRFLKSRDHRVQDNKNRRRPYVGIVLTVGKYKYFVPMESPKPNHANVKSGKHLMKLDGGRLGILGFNNMIPVHDSALIDYNIDKEPDPQYKALLQNQIRVINKNKADILNHAQMTYFDVVNKKNKFLLRVSCDFQALEKACQEYHPRTQKSKQPV